MTVDDSSWGGALDQVVGLQAEVQQVYRLIDSLTARARALEQHVADAGALVVELDRLWPAWRVAEPGRAAEIDGAARTLHRDLAHVAAAANGTETSAPRDLLLLTSNIQAGSIRLAALMLPPARMVEDGSPVLRDMLGVRWAEWLDGLLTYLEVALPLAEAAAALPGEPGIASHYRERLAALARILDQAAMTGADQAAPMDAMSGWGASAVPSATAVSSSSQPAATPEPDGPATAPPLVGGKADPELAPGTLLARWSSASAAAAHPNPERHEKEDPDAAV